MAVKKKGKSRKKNKRILVGIIIGAVVLAAGAVTGFLLYQNVFSGSREDVLEEYNIQPGQRAAPKWIDESRLTLEQTLLVRLLQVEERNIDELCELTGYRAPDIILALTDMELSGIIKQSLGRLYSLE